MGVVPINSFAVSVVLLRPVKAGFEVLLMERADSLAGTWCQVAGKIEEGEAAWQTALREVQEETGLIPETFYSGDFCEQFYEADRNCISIFPVFVGYAAKDALVVLNEEHHQFEWMSFDKARARVSFGGQRDMLSYVEREFALSVPSPYLKIERSVL